MIGKPKIRISAEIPATIPQPTLAPCVPFARMTRSAISIDANATDAKGMSESTLPPKNATRGCSAQYAVNIKASTLPNPPRFENSAYAAKRNPTPKAALIVIATGKLAGNEGLKRQTKDNING